MRNLGTASIVLSFVVAVISTPSFAYERLQTTVPATDGKHCVAYLHSLPDSKGLPILIALAGTGVYSTGDMANGNPVAQAMIDEHRAVVLTIDKPGIAYSEHASDHFAINDSIYNKYTQTDLISCVRNAIAWASNQKQSAQSAPLYFLAHSEGTQVAIRFYSETLATDSVLSARIEGLFLSGLVMKSWREIINGQLTVEEYQRFWAAYNAQDDNTLREFGDLAYAYWSDILSQQANEELLKQLAAQAPKVVFQVYHGFNDQNTPAQPVMVFERWNRERQQQSLPSLKFQARYYQASHGLNLAAVNDIIIALLAYSDL